MDTEKINLVAEQMEKINDPDRLRTAINEAEKIFGAPLAPNELKRRIKEQQAVLQRFNDAFESALKRLGL